MLSLHRWAFLVPFCIVSSAAFILSLYYPRMYTAQTSFERRSDPIMADLRLSPGAASFKLFRTTIARDLTSVDCMAEVMENIGLTADLPRRPDGTLPDASQRKRNTMARALGKRISIQTRSPNDQTDINEITYTGPDPTIGTRLLNELKATYTRRTMAWVQRHLESLRDYYTLETAEAMDQLRAAEREQTRLHLDNPYLNPRDPGALSTRLSQLESERNELVRRRREYVADLEGQRQILASIEAQYVSRNALTAPGEEDSSSRYLSPEAIRLMGLIEEIDGKVRELRRTRGMRDEHPEIKELLAARRWHETELDTQHARDHEMAVSNGPLETEWPFSLARANVPGEPWQSDRARLLVQIAAQRAKIKDIDISPESNRQEVARLTEAKSGIFDLQEEYADVTGRVKKARERYAGLNQTLGKIEPAIRANQQNKLLHWSVGEPARGTNIPVKPQARTVVLLALLAGIAAGVLFVILAEVLDHVDRSSGQVARSLGLPVLDAIDVIVTARDRRRLLVHKTVVAPLLLGLCLGLTGITGSLAYLSIQQPQTFQRIRELPQAALKAFGGHSSPSPASGVVEAHVPS